MDGTPVGGPLAYDVTASGECGHLLTSVLSDTVYQVTVGADVQNVTSSIEGTLYFTTTQVGALHVVVTQAGAIPTLTLHGTPLDHAIRLDWVVVGSLPVTTTWRIGYESDTGTAQFPAAEIPTSTIRSHTLVSLTNYVWYTVTLEAMLGETPWLTDTVRVMPTDRFVYLPLVLRSTSLSK
jgi:hypothetical protein